MAEKGSNYDIFKMDALKRFLTYEQESLIKRLNLEADELYIYVVFCGRKYRIGRNEPVMEYQNLYGRKADEDSGEVVSGNSFELVSGNLSDQTGSGWKEADSNGVLTICDLLCHTEDPIVLSGTFTTLEGLNRVKAGSGTILGDGFYGSTERYFDGHAKELSVACKMLGGVPMGKGDVAYRIPLFASIALQISFYESDDEFPAKLTFFLDKDICDYLFYETLWYMIGFVMETLKEIMEGVSPRL